MKHGIKYLMGLAIMVFLIGAVVLASADVEINETNFPDANFRQYLFETGLDADENGIFDNDELVNILSIECPARSISDLKGIEHFTSLETLICYENQLTTLDFSNNPNLFSVDCRDNKLTELNVTKNPALDYLYCADNQLTRLDVSHNKVLHYLFCDSNQLKNLNISNNKELRDLNCNSNHLKSLDLANNTELTYLYCSYNQIESLDVSKNKALIELYFLDNQISSIDISKNTALEVFQCGRNQISSLDVSHNPSLRSLYCNRNQIKSLDVSKNPLLEDLYFYYNQISEIDVSGNLALKNMNCGRNSLKKIDVSRNTALEYLSVQHNSITSIDVTRNTKLQKLYVSVNRIASINLSKNKKLELFCAEFTDLKTINISKCPTLCQYVKIIERQRREAADGGWDFDGQYDCWIVDDAEVLACDVFAKVIAGNTVSEPTETTEPGIGDVFESEGLKYKILTKDTVSFIGLKKAKSKTSITIPATVSISKASYKVTEIAEKALYKDTKVKTVIIGKNIKGIGKNAFNGCKNLKAIDVKTTKLTDKNVGDNAFKGIYKKATFTCPKKKLNAYKKLFIKKGAPKTCKFVADKGLSKE